MTTFIHIGTRKTGTTAIQRTLHGREKEMRGIGLNYPSRSAGLKCKSGPAHHFLAHALLNKRHSYTPNADFSEIKMHVEALRRDIDSFEGDNVISSEDLSRLKLPSIKQLATYFKGVEVVIVVYLRRQDEWLDSLYGQMLKVGRKVTVSKFIEQQEKSLDYHSFLQPWATYFGADNILVRTYEKEAKENILRDFLSSIGNPGALGPFLENKRINKSLSYEATRFLTCIDDPKARNELRREMEAIEAERPSKVSLDYLSEDEARILLDRFRDANNAVAQKYLSRDQLFDSMVPLGARGAEQVTIHDFDNISDRMITRLAGRIKALVRRSKNL